MTKLESLSEYCESIESLKRVQISLGVSNTVNVKFRCEMGTVLENCFEKLLKLVWISKLSVDYPSGSIDFKVNNPGDRGELVARLKRDLVAAGYQVISVVSSESEGAQ